MRSRFFAGVLVCAPLFTFLGSVARAQTPPSAAPPPLRTSESSTPAPQRQTVVVTGSWQPVPLEEVDRSINVYPLHGSALLFGSLTDAFDLDSSVQVQSRAPGGVQADLSIRGGSFAQTLVLLNGIRLSDAQSAHNNMDIPVPLDSVERVEILRG